MTSPDFEHRWQSRFKEFAAQGQDEAGVAGWSVPGLQTRLRFFARHWRSDSGSQWLDIGCGAGTYCHWLEAQGKQVVGLDYSMPSLIRAKEFYPQAIQWVNGSALALPFADSSFDGVICFGVTQVLNSTEPLLKEIYRISKIQSQFWIDGLNLDCVPHQLEAGRRKRSGTARHLNYSRPAQIASELQTLGFQVQKTHWLPMAPANLLGMQGMFEKPWFEYLTQRYQYFAQLVSHSYVLQGERI